MTAFRPLWLRSVNTPWQTRPWQRSLTEAFPEETEAKSEARRMVPLQGGGPCVRTVVARAVASVLPPALVAGLAGEPVPTGAVLTTVGVSVGVVATTAVAAEVAAALPAALVAVTVTRIV